MNWDDSIFHPTLTTLLSLLLFTLRGQLHPRVACENMLHTIKLHFTLYSQWFTGHNHNVNAIFIFVITRRIARAFQRGFKSERARNLGKREKRNFLSILFESGALSLDGCLLWLGGGVNSRVKENAIYLLGKTRGKCYQRCEKG